MKLIPWNALAIAGARSLIAGVVIALSMLLGKVRFCVTRRSLAVAAMLSATYCCFTFANKLTTAANAIVLQNCSPVFILLFETLVRHKPLRALDVGVVTLTILGVALCFVGGVERGGTLGNVLALTAGLTFALMLLSSSGLAHQERMSGILIGQMLTAFIGLPAFIFTKPTLQLTPVLCILALGVFQLGLAFVLYDVAAQYAGALTCSLLAVFEPLLNPVWVLLFTGEAPSIFALIGGVIVIGAVSGWYALSTRRVNQPALS